MFFGATDDTPARTLVVGLGNPILGDDGVGWHVVDVFARRLGIDSWVRDAIGPIEIDQMSVGGLTLMERIAGYERVVVVDAATDGQEPGTLSATTLDALDSRATSHLDSAHDVTLQRAVELARQIGTPVPREIIVITVSVVASNDFGDELSPAVEAAIEPAVDAIVEQLGAAVMA